MFDLDDIQWASVPTILRRINYIVHCFVITSYDNSYEL